MDLNSDEKLQNLLMAIKKYKQSVAKVEATQAEAAEALNKLKNASGGTGQGAQVLSEAISLLGNYFIKQNQ